MINESITSCEALLVAWYACVCTWQVVGIIGAPPAGLILVTLEICITIGLAHVSLELDAIAHLSTLSTLNMRKADIAKIK